MISNVTVQAMAALVALLAVGSGVAGCASGSASTRFTSTVNLGGARPIERLLVVANLGFSSRMYQAFAAGLTDRFKLCGIRSGIVHPDALDLDPEQRLALAREVLRPSDIMSINVDGGEIWAGSASHQTTVYSDLEIRDVATNQVIWQARSTLIYGDGGLGGDPEWRWGTSFATSVVSRLRDDGVLQHCPEASAGWPEIDASSEPRQGDRS